MAKIQSLLVILVSFARLIFGITESKYLQTEVLEETKECLNILKNKQVEELKKVKSVIHCSVQCTNHPSCRRFLYDKLTYTCTLFHSGENCATQAGTVNQRFCFRQICLHPYKETEKRSQKHICNEEKCTRCPVGYYGNWCESIIKDCSEGIGRPIFYTKSKTLPYIEPLHGLILEVFCRFRNLLTIVQYVNLKCKAINFDRPWLDYRNGFGQLTGNYWLGFRNIYMILQNHPQFELHVLLEDEYDWYQCSYKQFQLHPDYFNITIGNFQTDPKHSIGDFLIANDISGLPFSTDDQDFSNGCPGGQKRGWWFMTDPICSQVKVTDDEIIWFDGDHVLRNYTEFGLRLRRK